MKLKTQLSLSVVCKKEEKYATKMTSEKGTTCKCDYFEEGLMNGWMKLVSVPLGDVEAQA